MSVVLEAPAESRVQPTSVAVEPRPSWSLARRVAFRFTFGYFVLFLSGAFPFWQTLAPWVARTFLGLPEITVFTNGSGDTTFNWVQVLCQLVLAGGATAVWSLAARRARDHATLHAGLRIAVRYFLALVMVVYGMNKVFVVQFGPPDVERLTTRLGDISPMGLVWFFMGASPGYTIFTGLAEVVGGVLLFARRTTTLGALVVFGVMSNVVMLNLCYDVPVKLLSSHLLLWSVFLLVPDLHRLAAVLVLNRPAPPADLSWPAHRPWVRWTRIGLKAFVVVSMLLSGTVPSLMGRALRYGGEDGAEGPVPHGVYEVASVGSSATPWRFLCVDGYRGFRLRAADERVPEVTLHHAEAKKTLELRDDDGEREGCLAYRIAGPRLSLEGELRGEPLRLDLVRLDLSSFELTRRGFHWVNEYPYHR